MRDDLSLIQDVADLKEEEVLKQVNKLLADGEDPFRIVYSCQQGMIQVGERYSKGQYFLAGLIMAGEILRQVMELIGPEIINCQKEGEPPGTVVLGTVRNDIHDLGKNIVKMLLTCHGITVYDLGVDVSPSRFVEESSKIQPQIIGLSGLITASYNSMKETIDLLNEEMSKWPNRPPIIIGGSQMDKQICEMVGADYWVNKADDGVAICTQLLGKQ